MPHEPQSNTTQTGADRKTTALPKQWRFPHSSDWEFMQLPETLWRNHKVIFKGLTFKCDEEGVLVVLKGMKDSQDVVHFSGGQHWEDAVEVFCYEAAHGTMTWKPDRYAR